jgi:hypothetical protein
VNEKMAVINYGKVESKCEYKTVICTKMNALNSVRIIDYCLSV